jgi:hypothetical protein
MRKNEDKQGEGEKKEKVVREENETKSNANGRRQ